VELAGVHPAVIERHGAVSPQVAAALADGAMNRFAADVGIGVTGIAGPDGGSPDKPVGMVCFCVTDGAGERIERTLQLPGARTDVRDRSTTVTMHLLRRLLRGERDAMPGGTPQSVHA
jgi:nicotinamide-nucleotide amidase